MGSPLVLQGRKTSLRNHAKILMNKAQFDNKLEMITKITDLCEKLENELKYVVKLIHIF